LLGGSFATIAMVSNSTISGNSALSGGGIFSDGQEGRAFCFVSTSTVSDNQGGGIFVSAQSFGVAILSLVDTILNAGASGPNIASGQGGEVSSGGYNLSSDDGSGYLIAEGDQINTDPMLGPLRDNGGSTFTHELLPLSPAINRGNPNFSPP